jgi:cell division protein FtsB
VPAPAAPAVQRLLLAVLPAAILVGIGASAIWGESGLLARHALGERLAQENAELAAIERANQQLYRELVLLERDRVVVERAIAEGLGWARDGTTVYRFEPSTQPDPPEHRGARPSGAAGGAAGESAAVAPAEDAPGAAEPGDDSDGGAAGAARDPEQ